MRFACFLIACTLAVPTITGAALPQNKRRDKALQRIAACERRNEASSKQCRHLNEDIKTLETLYLQGDRSVLPTLLQFTYQTWFFGDAITADPETFLTAVSHLPERRQRLVAGGLAGGMFGIPLEQFEAIRRTLLKVPASSPNFQLAHMCLRTLETENASLIVDYFPPQTFTGRNSGFLVHWFSRELHALEEKPLWPSASGTEHTYRVTVLPSFSPPESVTLTVMPDGTGQIRFRTIDPHTRLLEEDSPRTVTRQQVVDFMAALRRAQFREMPANPPPSHIAVMDGAEWVLEVVRDGRYRIVHRTCPSKTPFGVATLDLFNLSGHKSKGAC